MNRILKTAIIQLSKTSDIKENRHRQAEEIRKAAAGGAETYRKSGTPRLSLFLSD